MKKSVTQLITIWENIDGCAEQYRSATALLIIYLILNFSNAIIDHYVSAPVHGKYVVDGLNNVDKNIIDIINIIQLS